jgi:hypothetical protein
MVHAEHLGSHPKTFLAFPAFLAGWDIREFVMRPENYRKKLGGYLGVNGR